MTYKDDMFSIEQKWKLRMNKDKLYDGIVDKTREKYFITVPYAYTSGALHIGHGRTYVTADIIARYNNKLGKNVFWPMAYHVSGTPVIAVCDGLKRKDPDTIRLTTHYLETYKEADITSTLKKLEDPCFFAHYFAGKFAQDFRGIALSLDLTREFTTMDAEYNDFITWQFHKLKENNLLIKADYPVIFDIIDRNAVGEDDIKDGDTDKVTKNEFKMFKFELLPEYGKKLGYDKLFLLASTLRPETIFGVTNLWIEPNTEYAIFSLPSEEGFFVASLDGVEKLSHQKNNLQVVSKIKGKEILLSRVKVLDLEVPVLPGSFVDPDIATGIVYSVPAHAPFDYLALEEAKRNPSEVGKVANSINLIPLVDIEGFDKFSAKEICEKNGLTDLSKSEKIEQVTKELYKVEFYNGVLNSNARQFSGMAIRTIKDGVTDWLKKDNIVDIFYETSRKAITRAGHKVIISMLKDQWFIDYSGKALKTEVRKHLNNMSITPEKYRNSLLGAIDWIEKRPCARKRGLGTRFPFDTDWVIESLSDSTIYMAFYTIVDKLNPVYRKNKDSDPDYKLAPEFFDYVFYGKGKLSEISNKAKIPELLITTMRDEFEYWYPVDIRHTAPPHISNHLSFYLMNHACIFSEDKWPRAQSFNEMLIREGTKMSKSKGNVISLVSITEKYGVDIYRLYVASNADLDRLVDWREEQVDGLKHKFFAFSNILETAISSPLLKETGPLESLFLAKYYNNYQEVLKSYGEFKFREVAVTGFFKVLAELKEYEKLGGKETNSLVRTILDSWLVILEPIMPFVTQEFFHRLGNNSYLYNKTFSDYNIDSFKDNSLVEEYSYIESLVEDIKHIELLSKPTTRDISFYTAEPWTYEVLKHLNKPMPEVIAMADKLGVDKKSVAMFYQKAKKRFPDVTQTPKIMDEQSVLAEWKKTIELTTNMIVYINPPTDPMNKKKFAMPSKPSIYME